MSETEAMALMEPVSIPILPEIDAETWKTMTKTVIGLIRGKCTLVPILDDPLNPMLEAIEVSADVLESTFVPIQARVGPNRRNEPYCVIEHFYEEDGHDN